MPEEVFETPQPTSLVEQKSTDWTKIILGAVVGLGLLATTVYAGYWYGIRQDQQAEKTTSVSQPKPTPSVEDETKTWRTYTNTKYNYSLDVPGSMVVVGENRTRDTATEVTTLRSSIYETDESVCRGGCTFPVVEGWSLEISVREGWSSGFDREFFTKSPPVPLPGILFEGEESVSGVKVLITERPRSDLPDLGNTDYYADFVKGGNWYRVIYTADKSKETVRKSVFDQILSTFKFIEVEDQTKDWQTYRNEEYGFEFGYPQNFQVTEGLGQYFLNQKPVIELKSDSFSYLQNTIDAYFTVSVKSNAKAECEYVPRGVIDTLQNKEINGVSFTVFSVGGAATGNTYSNTILHRLENTTCYEVVTTIHEASDGSIPKASSQINEQKTKLENQLDQVLSTFKFLD